MFVLALAIPVVIVLILYTSVSGWGFPEGPVRYSAHHLRSAGRLHLGALDSGDFHACSAIRRGLLVLSLRNYWNSWRQTIPLK